MLDWKITVRNKAYMTKDTIESFSVYEAAGKKWKLVKEVPQGCRHEIKEFLESVVATEIDNMYTDLAAYHFYMVFDLPPMKE